jgi:hypothetical protein
VPAVVSNELGIVAASCASSIPHLDGLTTTDAARDIAALIDATRAPILEANDDHALLALRATQLEAFLVAGGVMEMQAGDRDEKTAIRAVDQRHMITVGVIPWAQVFKGAKPLFYAPEVGGPLDFVSVHFYPKAVQVEESLAALRVYAVGKPLVIEEIFPLEAGGYVADMPGIKALSLWDTQPEELDGYFPELRPLVQYCQFSNCSHQSEPGCAVRQAVDEGRVHPERYESYLRMRFGAR